MRSQFRAEKSVRRMKTGFTLIELLVVITIISILAAILFPVFARVRENARRSSCMSNMKQITLGIIQYAMDNDGRIVGRTTPNSLGVETTDWNRFNPIQPYFKSQQILFCPSAPSYRGSAGGAWGSHYGFPVDFGNSYGNAGPMMCAIPYNSQYGGGTVNADFFPNAALTCLLGETHYSSSANSNYVNLGYGSSGFGAVDTSAGWLNRDRHLEGANYAYMDGHVKWLKKEAVDAVYVAQGNRGVTEAQAAALPIVFSWRR